jgi:hypothetical protein
MTLWSPLHEMAMICTGTTVVPSLPNLQNSVQETYFYDNIIVQEQPFHVSVPWHFLDPANGPDGHLRGDDLGVHVRAADGADVRQP